MPEVFAAREAARTPLHRLPPQRAVRKLLARQLKHAEAAGQRLAERDDEALHDFRVALRRFRSIEKAHRIWLEDALPRKLRRRLKELVDATGPARDAEVQLQWLQAQRAALRPAELPGYQWLRQRLEDRQRQGYAAVRAGVPLRFAALGATLRAALAMPAESSPHSFAQASGEQLRPLLAQLGHSFTAIGPDEDMAGVHDARLLIKRARYLLEPVAGVLADGKELLSGLGALQDRLGALHDAEVLGAVLAGAAADAGAERYRQSVREALETGIVPRRRGDPLGGLIALARRVRAQMRDGRAELLARIGRGEVRTLLQEVDDAARLLAALPAQAATAAA